VHNENVFGLVYYTMTITSLFPILIIRECGDGHLLFAEKYQRTFMRLPKKRNLSRF
jgi:hypothetical protein